MNYNLLFFKSVIVLQSLYQAAYQTSVICSLDSPITELAQLMQPKYD